MSQAHKKYVFFWFPGLVVFMVLLAAGKINAQNLIASPAAKRAAPADTARLEWSEESAYEIARLRIQRWLIKHRAQAESATFQNISAMLREADAFAQDGDYVSAEVLLEAAFGLMGADMPSESRAQSFVPASSSPAWQWRREALAGIDLSRLEYNLGNDDLDLSYADFQQRSVQDHANPYAGARLQLARNGGAAWDFRGLTLLKTGRDYHAGTLELAAQNALAQETFWRVENRWEGTSYRDTTGLRYWQNTSLLQGAVKLGEHVRVEVDDEFRVRRYGSERAFSPNYLHNEIGVGTIYSPGYATRLQARYEYGVRSHPRFPQDDYREHRLEANVSQNTLASTAVFVQNIWRRRIYPLGVPDSTFQNTFQEEFLRADLTLALSEVAALRLDGDLTLRQYETPSVFTPDFLNARINPRLQFKLWRDLQASVGYVFLLQAHGTQPGARDSQLTGLSGFYEDYYANGLTLGLDLFSAGGLLLSANHTFEVRIYSDSPVGGETLFNPNPDRNNNSFLFFLSWQINPRWQVNTIANFDSQISRSQYREDLRNTIFSFEAGYSF